MICLAIDTTSPTASLAILEDGKIRANEIINGCESHSVTMLPMIDHCLSVAQLTLKQVQVFACAVGPGSYTGVRIGVSTLKGLAFAEDIPCVGVSTLEAMARQLSFVEGWVVPVMNARRGQVYTATFEMSAGKMKRLSEDRLVLLADLLQELAGLHNKVYFTGDAYGEAVEAARDIDVQETPEVCRYASALGVAFCAMDAFDACPEEKRKESFSSFVLAPVYLQKVQAEREREERLQKSGES